MNERKSEFSKEEMAILAVMELVSTLADRCTTQVSECEERQRPRAEALVAIHDAVRLLDADDSLELFKETLPTIWRSFGPRSPARRSPTPSRVTEQLRATTATTGRRCEEHCGHQP